MNSFKILSLLPWLLLAAVFVYFIKNPREGKGEMINAPSINHVNLIGDRDFSIDVGGGSYINIFKKKEGWNMTVRINDSGKMLHLFIPQNGGEAWTAIDNRVNNMWVVDSGIDGIPDWRGLADDDKEIFEELKSHKIIKSKTDAKIWKSGQDTYEFNPSAKKFQKLQ
jgi:hypothetical protein